MSSSSSSSSSSPVPSLPTLSRPTSLRSGSTSSLESNGYSHDVFLLSTAYQLPLSSIYDLPSAKFSSTSPDYDMSQDPISQNFNFEDIFDSDDDLSMAFESKVKISRRSKPASVNMSTGKVTATQTRMSTTKPRRQKQQLQSTELANLPEAEAVQRFSFSHYPPIPHHSSTSLDGASRRKRNDVPSRTSPGAARLHEMLARGR